VLENKFTGMGSGCVFVTLLYSQELRFEKIKSLDNEKHGLEQFVVAMNTKFLTLVLNSHIKP
jgi:hypothetical protein